MMLIPTPKLVDEARRVDSPKHFAQKAKL